MCKQLEHDQLQGIPRAAQAMLEILVDAGVFQTRTDHDPFWSIGPPGGKAAQDAVKLSDPSILLAGLESQPTASAEPVCATPTLSPTPTGTPAPPDIAPLVPPVDAMQASSPPLAPAPEANRPPAVVATYSLQLELPIEEEEGASLASADSLTSPSEAADPPTPQATPLRLEAPMRLAAGVRAALFDIPAALNRAETASDAELTEDGLSIAWSEFERRRIEPCHTLRALTDARMLEPAACGPSSARGCVAGGQPRPGLTIAKSFLHGEGARAAPREP